ncbi:MAG: hypothetical protein HY308_10225 [Gammaproteobacteria bacterium]|nr:hypothetical protein [Gammaproteobacteria bacterium]
MFETTDYAEIDLPAAFREDGSRAWSYVFRRLHVPWFHLIYQFQAEDNVRLKQPAFLSEVYQLCEFQAAEGVKVEEVQVVLPSHMTGANRWTMEPLVEIWEGIEPHAQGQKAYVYVLGNGNRLMVSGLDTKETELLDRCLVFRSPTKKRRNKRS